MGNEKKFDMMIFFINYIKEKLMNGHDGILTKVEFQQTIEDFLVLIRKRYRENFTKDNLSHIIFEELSKTIVDSWKQEYSSDKNNFEFEGTILKATENFHNTKFCGYKNNEAYFSYDEYVQKKFGKLINPCTISLCGFSSQIVKVAKKTAKYFVLDIAKRYIKAESSRERSSWPCQCTDIKKWIFEKDLGSVLELHCKKDELKTLYEHMTRQMAVMLKDNSNLKISNAKNGSLVAYSNYIKLVGIFDWSKSIGYNEYELQNIRIDLDFSKINKNEELSTFKFTCSDPYGEWSDEHEYRKGKIDDTFDLFVR